jgi:hypothetical protein
VKVKPIKYEPAMRHISINENYDDEEDEEMADSSKPVGGVDVDVGENTGHGDMKLEDVHSVDEGDGMDID